jgi:hypothetical protein
MVKNVNTVPSRNNMEYTIRWMSFESKQNSIEAKVPENGKAGKLPNVSKVEPTYIIEENGNFNRYEKVDSKKLRKIKGAIIKDEEKKKRIQHLFDKKYNQERDSQAR